ncbi:MAG: hypothetical protein ABIW48_09600, partial [Burkholderiales bacterium]
MSAIQLFQNFVIKHPSDFSKVAGYVDSISNVDAELDDVVYSYFLEQLYPCSINTCHRPHKEGVLVQLKSGLISNVGIDCGRRYFGKVFGDKLNNHQERKVIPWFHSQLAEFKAAAPQYRAYLERQKEKVSKLAMYKAAFQNQYPKLFEELKTKANVGMYKVSKFIEISEPILDDSGNETGNFKTKYVENQIGRIDGISCLSSNAMEIIIRVLNSITDIETVSVKSLSFRRSNRLYNDCVEIDQLLA